MKVRSDFVSNSSSSSFILGENDLFAYYKVTVSDLTDALMELYGKKEYDEYLNKDWNTDHSPPFYVYALPDKNNVYSYAHKCGTAWLDTCDGQIVYDIQIIKVN